LSKIAKQYCYGMTSLKVRN